MNYNEQQKQAVEYKGNALSINSGAGTGKTSVLEGYARANLQTPMLYVCYNEAIQKEAKDRFPPNVKCVTGHAMAFAIVGKLYSHKLVDNYRLTTIKDFIKTKSWEVASNCLTVFNNYLSSDDEEFNDSHAKFMRGQTQKDKQLKKITIGFARKLWLAATDKENAFPLSHDVYLKMYCLSEPNLSRWFGVILFDEAQDANPVIAGFLFRNKCKMILVGDQHQQLYRFRNAINAMKHFEEELNADVLIMNKSFRFGPSVAVVASAILKYKSTIVGCPEFPIEGNSNISDFVTDKLTPKELEATHTKLHRTVQGVFDTAINNIHRKIFWVGGIGKYNLQELLDVYHLSVGDKKLVKRKKLLVDYKSYDIYKESAEGANDFGMKRIIGIIKDHGKTIVSKVNLLNKNAVRNIKYADLVISTAHRSKGLEWPFVVLADDFADLFKEDLKLSTDSIGDELNLLYVACTRAQKTLLINDVVKNIIDLYGENKNGKSKSFQRVKTNEKPVFNRVKIGE